MTYADYNMSLREQELVAIVTKQPSLPEVSDVGLWLDHVFSAVEKKFGHVQITNLEEVKEQLQHFVDDLQFEVVDSGTKKDPNITQPCILDISYKKFCNNQGDSDHNSIVQVTKNTSLAVGPRYQFFPKNGVHFDHKYDMGSQIFSISMTGGFLRVGDCTLEKEQKYNDELRLQYGQEENIAVPQGSKIIAKITTSSMKYELEYTLRFFGTNKKKTIKVCIVRPCQKKYLCCIFENCLCCCFCCKPRIEYLSAADLLHNMPNLEVFSIEDILPDHLMHVPPTKPCTGMVYVKHESDITISLAIILQNLYMYVCDSRTLKSSIKFRRVILY